LSIVGEHGHEEHRNQNECIALNQVIGKEVNEVIFPHELEVLALLGVAHEQCHDKQSTGEAQGQEEDGHHRKQIDDSVPVSKLSQPKVLQYFVELTVVENDRIERFERDLHFCGFSKPMLEKYSNEYLTMKNVKQSSEIFFSKANISLLFSF